MNPTYDFTGQVAFVTGASSGMGLTTARAFAASGAAVALADIDETAVNAAAQDLTDAGHQALALVCDVSEVGPQRRGVPWGRGGAELDQGRVPPLRPVQLDRRGGSGRGPAGVVLLAAPPRLVGGRTEGRPPGRVRGDGLAAAVRVGDLQLGDGLRLAVDGV